MDHQPHPHPQPQPSRPPLTTSETKSTVSSNAPTLCEKPDDISSFLRGAGDYRSDDGAHKRRRWTHFALVAIVALFLGSCGGVALSGLLFWGIGVVDGMKVQWIAQSLVMFASITSLLYVLLHIRASRLGRSLFASYNKHHLQPAPRMSFQHVLQSHATLTIRAAVVFWTTAMPAVAMGVYYGGRTILKLDLLVCAFGLVSTAFFTVILHMVDEPFEVAVVSPMYLTGGRRGSYPSVDPENGPPMGAGPNGPNPSMRGGKKSKSSSISSTSSSSSSEGSSCPSPTSGSSGDRSPSLTYPRPVSGPRPFPGGPNLARGKSGRVLTRLSAINVAMPPAPVPVPVPAPAPQPAEQRGPITIVSGVANTLTSYLWPRGNSSSPQTGQGGGGNGGGAGPVSDNRRPVSAVGNLKDNMPGTFYGEGGHYRG